MLFKILPIAIPTRIPQLPSLRKSVSTHNVTDQHHLSASQAQCSQRLEVGFVEEASVTSSPELSRPRSSRSSVDFPWSSEYCRESPPSREWRYATNGINLLGTVVSESQCPNSRSQTVSRQQYIHSLAYLLHGVPEDLSPNEKETLLSALPEQLQQPPLQKDKSVELGAARGPSVVHRLCASGIVQIFLFFQVFLPYLRHFIQLLYQFERTNHVSERVLAAGMSAVDGIGKKSSDVLGIIVRSGNGRIVQLVAAVSIWWIKEVSNGIQDGVEGCVELVDESKNQERNLKHRNDATKSRA